MKKFASFVFAVALCATFASAAVVEDFENWTGAGTVVADPDNAANSVLALGRYQYVEIPLPAAEGVVTVDVYDFGEGAVHPTSQAGPRWCVEGFDTGVGAAVSTGATIIYRTFMDGNNGYGYSAETSRNGTWFSPSWFGGPRQCTMETWLDTNADDILDEDQNDGVGQWTTWTFTVASDGSVEISAFNTAKTAYYDSTPIFVPNMDKMVLSAGNSGTLVKAAGDYATYSVLFDNVTLSSAVTMKPGDANGDDAVDIQDFVLLKQNYGKTGGAVWGEGDFNADGNVDIQDFVILKQNYGS